LNFELLNSNFCRYAKNLSDRRGRVHRVEFNPGFAGKYPDAESWSWTIFARAISESPGFSRRLCDADVSRLDWLAHFKDMSFDVIFHEASITDTTIHDQYLQAHDNIEGFRRLLEFAAPGHTPVVYASSAATYGIDGGKMKENQPPAPANVYAFTKVQLDNLARLYARRLPSWRIVGLRYFNVYGPREAHKKAAASMIYQLYTQMKAGKRPRVFRAGEQKRDFVYVKDAVSMTILAASSPHSQIYNCGSGHPFSFNEVIAELNKNLGTQLEPEYFENPYSFYQPHTEADMTFAKAELNYSAQYPPAKGIADYLGILDGRV
jgi:ADP-L-glycero-D-manno-heptose 6-epimerase